jgi:hypothetical protein
MVKLKLNEIESAIKMVEFNKEGPIKVRGSFTERWPGKFLQ